MPHGLFDAYIAMIPMVDGDATPLGQRLLCVLLVAYRLWASVRMEHWESGFVPWCLPQFTVLGEGAARLRLGILRLLMLSKYCLEIEGRWCLHCSHLEI